MTRLHTYLHCLLLTALWSLASLSFAQTCTFASSSANLGAPSSFTVNTSPQTITTTSGYRCAGSVLSILGTNKTGVTISAVSNNMRLYSASANAYIPYQLCKTTSCNANEIFSTNTEVVWSSTTLLGLLGLFNASDGTLPIAIRTSIVNVPAGIYTGTVTLTWTYEHCSIAITPLICIGTTGGGTTTINISMEVKKACEITDAADVDFGTAALPSKFTDKSSSISVRCTSQSGYTVNLTSSTPVNGSWRQMAATVAGSTYYLQYQLRNASNAVWTHLTDLSATGNGNIQTIPYTATVNLAQPNLPAGSYKDVITVTVTY